ncbi:MAG TPA: hypothetical protein VHO29_05510 [Marmoricola sp.]|nr:hypothetical protein [Marmoricola sp.]
MTLVPCSDASVVDWITRSSWPWDRLVTFGPEGFDAYARLRVIPDPEHEARAEDRPAFVWPADQAWCPAFDVDPHWAGVGSSAAAVEALLVEPGLDVVVADPLVRQPAY